MQDRYVLPPDFIPSKADIAGAAVHARRVADEVGLARDFCRIFRCRRNGRCVGRPCFHVPPPTEQYTLALPDALPI